MNELSLINELMSLFNELMSLINELMSLINELVSWKFLFLAPKRARIIEYYWKLYALYA